MAGQSSAMFCWSWTEVIVLGSQVFDQNILKKVIIIYNKEIKKKNLAEIKLLCHGFILNRLLKFLSF